MELLNPKDDPALFHTVTKCMIHGPYGERNPIALCIDKGKCTKRYPKAFGETIRMDEEGYPMYRQRNDG